MKSLKVLLVTYSFPPVGGVGVLRAASLARYLPSEGIQLDVLTARNPSTVGTDPTQLKEIPAEVAVHRTITLDLPFSIKKRIKRLIVGAKTTAGNTANKPGTDRPGLLKRVVQDLLLPDPQVTWIPVLFRAARRIVKERNIDLVLITVPPFSTALLVERLRKEFPGLAIVLDFRDEWLSTTIDLVSFSKSKHARNVAHRSEEAAVLSATAIVAVSDAARREIRGRYPRVPDGKFHHIPNGFDATRLQPATQMTGLRADGKIVVTYIGTIYNSTEPTALVEALRSLPPEIKSRFTFRFIGHIEESRYREALLSLGDMVELKGFMAQSEALNAMNDANYVLLISHDRLNISAKFYDYLGSGKPILACIHPEGDLRRMLEDLRVGWWADSRQVQSMRQLFVNAALRGNSLLTSFQPDLAKIGQYERRPIAQRYAVLLHSIAGKQPEIAAQAPASDLARKA